MPFSKGAPKPPGSGRKKGGKNLVGCDVRELAGVHTPAAIETLVEVMTDKQAPHTARVLAANALLDRAHGKPPQAITGLPQAVVNLDEVRRGIRERLDRIAAASPGRGVAD
jgi:hypothetical protein